MATKRRRSDAAAFTESKTITVANTWATNDTGTITINGKDITITVGATVTTAAVATALKEAWNGDTITGDATRNNTGNLIPEANLISASVAGSVVTLTNDTTGVPFTVTVSENTAGTGTLTLAALITGTGPLYWTDADNWTSAAIPANGDDIFLENHDGDILYGLAQSAVALTSLNIYASWTGRLGLPDQSEEADYYEYRETYLAIGSTTTNIGEGPGEGSPRIRLDTGAGGTILNLWKTGTAPDAGIPAMLWKGTGTNTINIHRGDLGIAWLPGESATVATLRVGYVENLEGDAIVRASSGLTLTTLEMTGGKVTLNAGLTTVTMTAGQLEQKAGNITTINCDGGTIYWDGTGTITTLKLGEGAVLDCSRDMRDFTITNCTLERGARIIDPFRRITFTNPVTLNRCGIKEVDIDLGQHITIQVANAA